MKVFNFNEKSVFIKHQEEVNRIRNYLSDVGYFPIVISDMRLEILWYAFSESYDAQFLIPDEEYFLPEFAEWLSKLDYKDAINMDAYGNIREDEDDDYNE